MAKFDWLPKSVNRKRRIIGRVINSKQLPQFVYRFDKRAPALIRATGFQPRNGAGVITEIEHVNNAYAPDHAKANQQTKDDSQFVSTGGYGMLKNIDPTFAQQVLQTNIYKIDTYTALKTGLFFDANDHFDKKGIDRPYPTQREWIKQGGIDQAAVIATMTGQTFVQQLDGNRVAPDENQLRGWQKF